MGNGHYKKEIKLLRELCNANYGSDLQPLVKFSNDETRVGELLDLLLFQCMQARLLNKECRIYLQNPEISMHEVYYKMLEWGEGGLRSETNTVTKINYALKNLKKKYGELLELIYTHYNGEEDVSFEEYSKWKSLLYVKILATQGQGSYACDFKLGSILANNSKVMSVGTKALSDEAVGIVNAYMAVLCDFKEMVSSLSDDELMYFAKVMAGEIMDKRIGLIG